MRSAGPAGVSLNVEHLRDRPQKHGAHTVYISREWPPSMCRSGYTGLTEGMVVRSRNAPIGS